MVHKAGLKKALQFLPFAFICFTVVEADALFFIRDHPLSTLQVGFAIFFLMNLFAYLVSFRFSLWITLVVLLLAAFGVIDVYNPRVTENYWFAIKNTFTLRTPNFNQVFLRTLVVYCLINYKLLVEGYRWMESRLKRTESEREVE